MAIVTNELNSTIEKPSMILGEESHVKRTEMLTEPFRAGFIQVMENLESHGIYDFNFQTWKVTSVV